MPKGGKTMSNIQQKINVVKPDGKPSYRHFNTKLRESLRICQDFGCFLCESENQYIYKVACKIESGQSLTPRQASRLHKLASKLWNSEGLGERTLAALHIWGAG